MLKSTQYGFSTTPGRTQSYQFYQLREDTLVWEPVTNRVAFKPSVLPEDYELRFIKMPDETFSPLPVQNQSSIAIEFHANGDITPFILEIRDDQKRLYQISGDRSGNIELLLPR